MSRKLEPIILEPYEPVDPAIIDGLKRINAKVTWAEPDTDDYISALAELFHLDPADLVSIDPAYMGGFFAGEASVFVGLKRNLRSRLGVDVRAGFELTQHINGVGHLIRALKYFQAGAMRFKSGSLATFCLHLHSHKYHDDLRNLVVPFYEHHVISPGSAALARRVGYFKRVVDLLHEGADRDVDRLIDEVLPLWDLLRVQHRRKNAAFRDLDEAVEWVRDCASR